jgi:GTP-binding protein
MAYAEVSDIELRWHELDSDEQSRAAVLIDDASAMLDALVNVDTSDDEQLELLKMVCCNMVIRALSAIDRADVCVIMIDATTGVTEQDTRIAGLAHDSGKASIICVNKWDIAPKETGTAEWATKVIRERLGFMTYAPVLFISAKNGQRVDKLFDLIKTVNENANKRLSTSVLNQMISEAVTQVPTPQDKGRHLKIYYGTQVAVKPPTIALFVNDKNLSHFSYERYLENQLRRNFGFEGVPIRLLLRNKNGTED